MRWKIRLRENGKKDNRRLFLSNSSYPNGIDLTMQCISVLKNLRTPNSSPAEHNGSNETLIYGQNLAIQTSNFISLGEGTGWIINSHSISTPLIILCLLQLSRKKPIYE